MLSPADGGPGIDAACRCETLVDVVIAGEDCDDDDDDDDDGPDEDDD